MSEKSADDKYEKYRKNLVENEGLLECPTKGCNWRVPEGMEYLYASHGHGIGVPPEIQLQHYECSNCGQKVISTTKVRCSRCHCSMTAIADAATTLEAWDEERL